MIMKKLILILIFLFLVRISIAPDMFYYGKYSEHLDSMSLNSWNLYGAKLEQSVIGDTYDGNGARVYFYTSNAKFYSPNMSSDIINTRFLYLTTERHSSNVALYLILYCHGGAGSSHGAELRNRLLDFKKICGSGVDMVSFECPNCASPNFFRLNVFELQILNDYGEPIGGTWYYYPMEKIIYYHTNFDEDNMGKAEVYDCASVSTVEDYTDDTKKLLINSYTGGPCWYGLTYNAPLNFSSNRWWYVSGEVYVIDTNYVDIVELQIPSNKSYDLFFYMIIDSSGFHAYIKNITSGEILNRWDDGTVRLQNGYEYFFRAWLNPKDTKTIIFTLGFRQITQDNYNMTIRHSLGIPEDYVPFFRYIRNPTLFAHFSQVSASTNIVGFDKLSAIGFKLISFFEVEPYFQGIDFGTLKMGDKNKDPAYYTDTSGTTHNYGYDSLKIRVFSSDDYNVSVKATDFVGPGGATISANNLKAGVNVMALKPTSLKPLSSTYTYLDTIPWYYENIYMFFELDVPTGISTGTYSNTITIRITQT